ncbi:hypothetical protein KCU81_g874, partial [Aureobasidium melanogenum]
LIFCPRIPHRQTTIKPASWRMSINGAEGSSLASQTHCCLSVSKMRPIQTLRVDSVRLARRSSVWSADRRASFKETISSPYQTWPEGCEPDPDQTMDSIMRTLIAEPYRPLDVKHNSPLLMIFEGFRNLRDENSSLLRKLKYEAETRFESHHELELERQAWQREREQYQAEVRRLELIISKNKEGRTQTPGQGSKMRESRKQPERPKEFHPVTALSLRRRRWQYCHTSSPRLTTTATSNRLLALKNSQVSLRPRYSSENGSIQHRDADTVGEEAADYSNLNETLLSKNGSIELEAQPTHYFDLRTPSIASRSTEQLGSRTPKVRPESLRLDHARRFSFEYGDENRSAQAKTQYSVNSPLQRSVSVGQFATKRTALSPCDASSTLAADGLVSSPVVVSVLEFPGISKIPSPTILASHRVFKAAVILPTSKATLDVVYDEDAYHMAIDRNGGAGRDMQWKNRFCVAGLPHVETGLIG